MDLPLDFSKTDFAESYRCGLPSSLDWQLQVRAADLGNPRPSAMIPRSRRSGMHDSGSIWRPHLALSGHIACLTCPAAYPRAPRHQTSASAKSVSARPQRQRRHVGQEYFVGAW